jgi:hypothetical protein
MNKLNSNAKLTGKKATVLKKEGSKDNTDNWK